MTKRQPGFIPLDSFDTSGNSRRYLRERPEGRQEFMDGLRQLGYTDRCPVLLSFYYFIAELEEEELKRRFGASAKREANQLLQRVRSA